MFIVGSAYRLRLEGFGLCIYSLVRYYADTARSYCVRQPSGEIGIAAKLSQEFAPYYKPTAPLFQPIEEELTRTWTIIPKDLVSDIVIHDGAHISYRPMNRRVSSPKNRL